MSSKLKEVLKSRAGMKPLYFFLYLLLYRKSRAIRFNIGSGKFDVTGEWICTDYSTLDITKDSSWGPKLRYLRLSNIVAEHVWEHLTDGDCELANRNCFKYLKRGGVLRIAVPDGYHPDKEYIEHVRPGGNGPGADDHKLLYNYKVMTERLVKAGFRVNLLEYWDENGKFHAASWNDANGYIRRSKQNDHRNKDGQLHYTSLIVDAVKP